MTHTSVVARLVVPLALLTLVAAACTTTSGAENPARERPDDHAHGTLVETERIAAPSGGRAWRVTYRSQRADGNAAPVTGVVIAPSGSPPKGGFPVVTWGHGLVGAADRCAPSRRAELVGHAVPAIAFSLDVVIVATDYAGLGTRGAPETGVGVGEGRNVLDLALAVRDLDALDVSDETIVAGDSMGGHAALFAAQMAPTYAPALRVAGVVVTAPAAMPRDLLAAFASSRYLGYALEAVLGYSAAYGLDPASILTPRALDALDGERDACADEVLARFADAEVDDVFAHDPASLPPWRRAMARNTPGDEPIEAPLLVLQGTDDPIVPVDSTDALVRRLRSAGDDVDYRVLDGVGHEPLQAAPVEIVTWIAGALSRSS
jgi:pimeloyl-ACP methyl ester carboxylesterase